MDHLRLEDESAFYNKYPILEIIKLYCNDKRQINKVLEIASGSGQHSLFFTQNIPTITSFQPTEYNVEKLEIINQINRLSTVVQPAKRLDVCNMNDWIIFEDNYFDLGLVTNLCHISPWKCTEEMFSGMSQKLKRGAYFLIYGPFLVNYKPTTESNAEFDKMLKTKNSEWGLRDISEIDKIASFNRMLFEKKIEMPENNFILVFQRLEN